VVLYFLCGFVLYAVSDFITWRWAWVESFRAAMDEHEVRPRRGSVLEVVEDEDDPWVEYDQLVQDQARDTWLRELQKNMKFMRLSSPVSVMRALFEFVLPMAVAGYAVYALWSGLPTR
jgi:hypothetical protein